MFRARIPAEAERKPRAKQEKTPAAYCKGVTNLMTPTLGGSQNITPTSVSKSERSPRNTQKTAAPAAKHTKRHFNKKNEKKLQNICTIQKPLPPLQRQKIIRVQAKIYAVFPRVCRRNSAHPATLFAGDSGKENGFFVNIHQDGKTVFYDVGGR